jgi:hypothetical protein
MIMKRMVVLLAVVCMIFMLCGSVFAGKDPVTTVTTGCEKELDNYCKNVTMGEGRILACLYAHSDKLSGRCEYALYDAAAQLERAVSALTYVANECKDDLKNYCSGVAMGEGRLIKCLKKHDDKVSDRCKQARKDAGIK